MIVGKPQNEHYQEYRQILIDETADLKLPILYNINLVTLFRERHFHMGRKCIDFEQATLKILEPWFVEAMVIVKLVSADDQKVFVVIATIKEQ